jgi:hypothetical protein
LSISSKFFIPIKGPEGHTDNTVTYTFIIKTHSIEQFNQNELTLQDCGIIIIYIFYIWCLFCTSPTGLTILMSFDPNGDQTLDLAHWRQTR